MNMPEIKCYLDAQEGTVLKLPPGDQKFAEVRADPKRYLPIEAIPSRIQYQWLDTFIRTVEDDALRVRMEGAINGKGAFRRFKDILLTVPDERRRWFEFRDQAMRQRVVDWVREKGLEPTEPPEWEAQPDGSPPAAPKNRSQDLEALRDFLVEWFHDKEAAEAVSPYKLEDLAKGIGEHFKVRPLKR